jgi:hypothetical protein
MSEFWPCDIISFAYDPSELALLTELSLVIAIVADLGLIWSLGGRLVSSLESESELDIDCYIAY